MARDGSSGISVAPHPAQHVDRISLLQQLRRSGVLPRLLQRRDHHLEGLGSLPRIVQALQDLTDSDDDRDFLG